MNLTIPTAGLALAAFFTCQTAQAASVTATFEGTLDVATGDFAAALGDTAILALSGDDTSPAGTDLATWIPGSFDAAASYALTGVSITVPGASLSETVPTAQFYVYDNLDTGLGVFDVIAAGIPGGPSTGFRYQAAFQPDTFAGAMLDVALGQGLAVTPVVSQSFFYSTVVPGGADGLDTLGANISLTDFVIGTIGGGGTGGGTGGGGGGGTGGGGGGAPSPVPLPAGGPLLIAGLGMLAWRRNRR